jgi:hypothetical protein
LAYAIGIGAVLFAISNPLQPAKDFFYLPNVGMLLLLLGVLFYVLYYWRDLKLGSKVVWIPLAVICASIVASSFYQMIVGSEEFAPAVSIGEFDVNVGGKAIASLLFAPLLFACYLIAQREGERMFTPFVWAAVIGALGILAWGIVHPGVKTGGYIISPTNYDIAVKLLVFGLLFGNVKRQWWLYGLIILGLFLTGADEGVFVLGVLFLVVLIRRDWKLLIVPSVVVVAALLVCTPLGVTQKLYLPTAQKFEAIQQAVSEVPVVGDVVKKLPQIDVPMPPGYGRIENAEGKMNFATNGRWITVPEGQVSVWRLDKVEPLGEGLDIYHFYWGIPHNVPLIITKQVGPLAALAWILVSLYMLVRSRRKYLWAGILALSLFDHSLWTQIFAWWWLAVGVSAVELGKREETGVETVSQKA